MLHLHELRFASDVGLTSALVKLHGDPLVETCVVEVEAHRVQFSAPVEHVGVLLSQLTGGGQLVDWQFSDMGAPASPPLAK